MSVVVKIDGYDDLGRGIAHNNGKVIFIPKVLIDEEVEIDITDEYKTYNIGKLKNVIKASSKRNKPICPYYNKCGGCNFLHVNHIEEINIKKNNFIKLTGLTPTVIESDDEYNYRNKVELKIIDNQFGYYEAKTHEFIKIDYCFLAKEAINNVIKSKECFDLKSGDIIIRCNYNDEIIIKINTNENYMVDINKLKEKVKLLGIMVNDKLIYGEDSFIEIINGYYFKCNINSFFQVNLNILSKIFDILSKNNYDSIVDLYCGVGVLGIAANKNKCYGIEINESSIVDAVKNSKLNKQNNKYLLGDSSNIKNIKDTIDTIIMDPPRSGLNKETLKNVLSFNPQKIIYMSCNYITLNRDLKYLNDGYTVNEVYLLDMFPKTIHCESFVILERK